MRGQRSLFLYLTAALGWALGCDDAVSPKRLGPNRDAAERPAIVRIAGLGRIGTGAEVAFDFDVRSDLTGRLTVSDHSVIRADGSVPTLRVDPTDAGTAVTAFRTGSSACSDPSRGAEFDATGREDTGGLVGFTVVACDNGPPENFQDFFSIAVPSSGLNRSGSVTSGDIARSRASSGDTLVVSTSSSGSNLDLDGYTVTLDGTDAQLSATNGSVTFAGLGAGDHSVALSGVAANCTVSGPNPPTVTVPVGGTARATFAVSCTSAVPRVTGLGQIGTGSPSPGNDAQTFDFDVLADLTGRFTATDYADLHPPDGHPATLTTDPSTDPATSITGYRNSSGACSDPRRGAEFDAVGREDDGTLRSYTVAVCDNGSAGSGMDFWSVFIPAEGFSISGNLTSGDIAKSAVPSSGGTIVVSTSTTGSSLPSGYTVTVDGTTSQSIGINSSVTFTGLAAGGHTVVLSSVPANCTVSGGTSQTVTVPSGGTATATFSVTCTTPPGNLTATTSTTGSSLPSGYTVTVDGTTSQQIGINNSVTFTNLTPGTHTVQLGGVANNCTVSGGTSRAVTVPSGGTATVSYSVSCVTPNQPPSVNAGQNETNLIGLFYTESAWFSDLDNDGPWAYTITWGDGSSTTGSTLNQGTISASHTYLLLGGYTIRVTVTDSQGASGSGTKVVTFIL